MSDNIVSVRMPESMLHELKQKAAQLHYMDLSEAVRDIVKQKAAGQPSSQTQELIAGLQEIINQLQDEAKQAE